MKLLTLGKAIFVLIGLALVSAQEPGGEPMSDPTQEPTPTDSATEGPPTTTPADTTTPGDTDTTTTEGTDTSTPEGTDTSTPEGTDTTTPEGTDTTTPEGTDTTTGEDTESTSDVTSEDASENSTTTAEPGTTGAVNDQPMTPGTPAANETTEESPSTPGTTEQSVPNAIMAPEDNSTESSETTTQAPDTVVPKGVSEQCLQAYHDCTTQEASDDVAQKFYCKAFKLSQSCISDSQQSENGMDCSEAEVNRLEQLDCGPVELLLSLDPNGTLVSPACAARLTECMSLAPGVGEVGPLYNFTSFYCDLVNVGTSCFTQEQNGTACTEVELNILTTGAHCTSSAQFLMPGVLLLIAMLFLQNSFSQE